MVEDTEFGAFACVEKRTKVEKNQDQDLYIWWSSRQELSEMHGQKFSIHTPWYMSKARQSSIIISARLWPLLYQSPSRSDYTKGWCKHSISSA